MAGVKALRRIQLGRETTAGTIAVATSYWRGVGTIEDQREIVFPEEDVGILGGVDRTYIPKLLAGITLGDAPATFEQLPHVLEAGIKAIGTGAADGTQGSDKIYAYAFPTTSLNTIKTYTIEGGDNQQAEVMEYGYVDSFGISGNAEEALVVSSEWIGRQVANTTFTTTATIPTVEEILFGKGKLYIDTAGGTAGTTQVTQTLLGMELSVKTGIIPKFTADGQIYFSFIQYVMPELELKLTYEHNGSAVTEKTAWRDQTPRQIQLKFEGSAVQTAGTLYSVKTLKIDLLGKYEAWEALDEQDGNSIVSCTFRSRYNATAAKHATITVVNELTSIP